MLPVNSPAFLKLFQMISPRSVAIHFSAAGLCFALTMLPAMADYLTWAAGQIPDPLQRATTADPDADGVDNLTEYAMGTAPLSASPALDVAWSGPDVVAIVPWAEREDVSLFWEISPDLAFWSPIQSLTESQSFNATGALHRSLFLRPPNVTRAFFRLRPQLDPPLTGPDDDGDGASNAWETARLLSASAIDSDADGLADAWEAATGQNPNAPLTPASTAAALEVFTPPLSPLQK